MPPIEAILAPLEAELKLARQEVLFHCLLHGLLMLSKKVLLCVSLSSDNVLSYLIV